MFQKVDKFLDRFDQASRIELHSDIEPLSLFERVQRSLAGIAGTLELKLPGSSQIRKLTKLFFQNVDGRIVCRTETSTELLVDDLHSLALEQFVLMGQLPQASAMRLATEFVQAVLDGVDVLPGFFVSRNNSSTVFSSLGTV